MKVRAGEHNHSNQVLRIRGNDLKVVNILRAMQNEPTLTDDQEDVITGLRRAYENGDIPQHITKNIVKELKTTDDLGRHIM